jgi:hypothetical protein
MGLRSVLGIVRGSLRGPLEVFVAAGHGRSYGQWSRVAVRGLPGILECGLWPALAAAPAGRTYALVSDVGNDLAYGVAPATLGGWVTACLDRLGEASVILVRLPAASLARIPPWHYHIAKALLFPGRRLPYATLQARVAETNSRLTALGGRPGVVVIEPRAEWYGLDAIHLRRRVRAEAWAEVLRPWCPDRAGAAATPVPARWTGAAPAPAYRTLLGVPVRRRQPSARLADGAPVSSF